MRSSSLQTRLILSFLLIILITVALMVLFANRITVNRFQSLAIVIGQRYARLLAPAFARFYEKNGGWEDIDQFLERFKETGADRRASLDLRFQAFLPVVENALHDERLIILNMEGNIIADSGNSNIPLRLKVKDKQNAVPIRVSNGEKVGFLIVASSLGAIQPYQSAYLRQVSMWILAAGVISALIGLWVSTAQSRSILKPVGALVRASRRVAAGDYSQQVPVGSKDELGEMADSFNSMVKNIELQQKLRRRSMADIAHELRTPLSVLQIDLESIEDGLMDPSPQVIERIKSEVAHLNHLVEDLRMLSLVEAGELQLDMQNIDLGELICFVIKRMENAALSRGISLEADLPKEVELMVRGDSQRLVQVLYNLLQNALQHTLKGGRVTVSSTKSRNEVHVSVKDNGEGISERDLPFIFDRFHRSDNAQRRNTDGTGLGLAIARSLVEAHGGRIEAHSVEGQGSTFTFSLPAL